MTRWGGVSLLVLLFVPTVGAAELTGTVTALRGGVVMVGYVQEGEMAPAIGDRVAFSEVIPGTNISQETGTGTVKGTGEGFVWVTVVTMSPRLKDIAIIEATGVVADSMDVSPPNVFSTESSTVTIQKIGLKRTQYYEDMMEKHQELIDIARDGKRLSEDSPSRKILLGAFRQKKKERDGMKAQLTEFIGKTITLHGKTAQDDPLKAQAVASESMIQNASLAKGTIHLWVDDKHSWQIQGSPPDPQQLAHESRP